MIVKYALTVLLVWCIASSEARSTETSPLFRAEEEGKWGFINRAGKFVIKPQYDDVYYQFHEGLAAVKIGRKWGYIDETGRMVISTQFDSASKFENGTAPVSIRIGEPSEGKEKSSYIDKSGNNLFDSDDSLNWTGFDDGVMPMKNDEKWGYISTKGKWAIPPQYKVAERFSEGLAGVCTDDGTAGFIDINGEWVIRLKHTSLCYEGFSEGLAAVFDNREKKYGFINRSGEFVIPPAFDSISGFSEGRAAVGVVGKDESGWPLEKWGAIDRKGKFVVPAVYRKLWPFENGMVNIY